MLKFRTTFSLFSFTLIKRLFSSSSLSAIMVVSIAYLRLLILLPAILIPAWDSSSLAIHMMYSAYKLNKQGVNTQPCHTPFPILNQSIVLCLDLTVASWPSYRFYRRQVRWSAIFNSLRIFYSLLWSRVKGFSVVNETEVDVFLEFSLAFAMIRWMLAIWSLVPLPLLNSEHLEVHGSHTVEASLWEFWALFC